MKLSSHAGAIVVVSIICLFFSGLSHAEEFALVSIAENGITLNNDEKLSPDSTGSVKDKIARINSGKVSTRKDERSTYSVFHSLGIVVPERIPADLSAPSTIILPIEAASDFDNVRFVGVVEVLGHKLNILKDSNLTRETVKQVLNDLKLKENEYSPDELILRANNVALIFQFAKTQKLESIVLQIPSQLQSK